MPGISPAGGTLISDGAFQQTSVIGDGIDAFRFVVAERLYAGDVVAHIVCQHDFFDLRKQAGVFIKRKIERTFMPGEFWNAGKVKGFDAVSGKKLILLRYYVLQP